jgi:hypothetical protein
MRRGLSILLALLFGVGPLSVALPGVDEAALPACCRRDGAHHCAMSARMATLMAAAERDGRTSVSAPDTCPYYPGPALALLVPTAHAIVADAAALPVFETAARAKQSTDLPDLSGPSGSHAGRGPPVSLLS